MEEDQEDMMKAVRFCAAPAAMLCRTGGVKSSTSPNAQICADTSPEKGRKKFKIF